MKSPILIYDFDGTLTPYAWTKFEILEKCGFDGGAYSTEFVDRVHSTMEAENLNSYSALWKEYLRALSEHNFSLTDENFTLGAQNLEYNPGVEDFLKRTNTKNAQNFILSSGLKVFLDHTKIAPQFSAIYATTFSYDSKNRADGIDYLMTGENKVNAIKEILAQNLEDSENINNVVYFGDGMTDFHAMKYIRERGGQTIFVHQPEPSVSDRPDPLANFRDPNIITFKTVADYSLGSPLDRFVAKLFE